MTLIAPGCGNPSPEEQFFERVCSTALPRAQEILDTHEAVTLTRAAPGPGAWGELLGLTRRGLDVARKFRAEMQALPALDTEAGRKAARFLELSRSTAFETMVEEERRVLRLPQNMTLVQSIRALEHLEFALITTFVDMTKADAVAAETDLLESYERADSCTELDELARD